MDQPNELLGALRQTLNEAGTAPPRRSNNLETTLETATHAVHEGAVEDGLAAVRAQRERLDMALHDLDMHTQGVEMHGTAGALVQRMRDLYAVNGQGLAALEAAVAARDAAAVERAADRLREITSDMLACQDAVNAEMTALEHESGGTVMVPESYFRLYEACDRVARGQIALVEWQKVLDGVDRDVRGVQERVDGGLSSMGGKLQEDAYAQGIAGEVQMGILETLKGLERMRAYKASSSVTDLNEGWNGLVAGNVRVQKAMRTLIAGQGSGGDVVILEDE